MKRRIEIAMVISVCALIAYWAWVNCIPLPKKPTAQKTVVQSTDTRPWLPCNASMDVKDLRYCPGYRAPANVGWDTAEGGFSPSVRPKHSKRKAPRPSTLDDIVAIGYTSDLPITEWPAGSLTTGHIITLNNDGPCAVPFTYDKDANLCSAWIQFEEIGHPVACTTLPPPDKAGAQKMTCTYTPKTVEPTPQPEPEPHCVMPADIDVCPVQMLDRKQAHQ